MAPMADFTTADTCARCGLRRLTLALEQEGTVIRLCDDCFWGKERTEPAEKGTSGRTEAVAPRRIQWGPLDDLATLRESVDALCEAPSIPRWRGRTVATGQPLVDIFETEHEFIIRADLPSIDPTDVEIDATDHTLIIKGEVKRDSEDRYGICLRRELHYGTFIRYLVLPCNVTGNHAKTSYEDGILEIRVPKNKTLKSTAQITAA